MSSVTHAQDAAPVLSVEGLTVAFEMYDPRAPFFKAKKIRHEILHDLSLSVGEGEIVALVGASGSGKTVLADAQLGLFEPNAVVSGDIRFCGERKDAEGLAALRGRQIAFVPQSVNSLDPLMPVGEQVRGCVPGPTPRFGLSRAVRADRRAEAERRCARQRELFRAYGLSPEVERMYPHELSGGMTRRVLLMCALMEQPRLIVADEPTPGMDLDRAVRAMDDLRAFANTGGSVLLITHDLELALRVADRVAVFLDGTVAEQVPARAFANPTELSHEFSRQLASEVRALEEESGHPGAAASSAQSSSNLDMPPSPLLRAASLGFSYGSRSLLHDVSLTLYPGERVALRGPSGAGKTTLCKLLAGVLTPSAGVLEAPEGQGKARSVQLIAQHPEQAFDPRMRMARSLSEAGELDGPRAGELMRSFGIQQDWLARLPHELSGGQLMRFCLVRALMAEPRVLICDESTAMLDLVTQAELWREIIALQEREGFAIVFVSHGPQLVRRLATRVVALA
ncbi:MAG: ATP-binding cassette domain-containing protein [Coriobacteriaceae bacterium]|nr:ATP-binding cassette domain-containing protein [Coriobacteriaceae bacterium]